MNTIKSIIIFILITISSCTTVVEVPEGPLSSSDREKVLLAFGLTADESAISNKDSAMKNDKCQNSQFASLCNQHFSHLYISTEHPTLGGTSSYYIYDFSKKIYLLSFSDIPKGYFSLTYYWPVVGTTRKASPTVLAKTPDRFGIYYVGHIYK